MRCPSATASSLSTTKRRRSLARAWRSRTRAAARRAPLSRSSPSSASSRGVDVVRAETKTASKAPRKVNKRSAARLAAVQALYQMDLAGTGLNDIVAEFDSHWLDGEIEDAL